jgi:hypothetical protein
MLPPVTERPVPPLSEIAKTITRRPRSETGFSIWPELRAPPGHPVTRSRPFPDGYCAGSSHDPISRRSPVRGPPSRETSSPTRPPTAEQPLLLEDVFGLHQELIGQPGQLCTDRRGTGVARGRRDQAFTGPLGVIPGRGLPLPTLQVEDSTGFVPQSSSSSFLQTSAEQMIPDLVAQCHQGIPVLCLTHEGGGLDRPFQEQGGETGDGPRQFRPQGLTSFENDSGSGFVQSDGGITGHRASCDESSPGRSDTG